MRSLPIAAGMLLLASAGRAQIAGPSISNIVGAADYASAGAIGIPQGSIFTISGANLSITSAAFHGPTLPLTAAGVTVHIEPDPPDSLASALAPLLYVAPNQINAILPSSLPIGGYFLHLSTTILIGGALEPFDTPGILIQVTGGRFAPFTRLARGFGPAAIQQYDDSGTPTLNEFTNAAPPGAVMSLYGTGLGPLRSGSDTDPAAAGSIRDDVTVWVGGIPVKPLYAGRAPTLFGVDQINFSLPTGTPEGCYVPLQVVTGAAFSSPTTISVSSHASACPSELGLPADTLEALDLGGTIVVDVLNFSSVTSMPYPPAQIAQTVDSWRARYDASTLSALITTTEAPAGGTSLCTESSPPAPDIHGVVRIAASLSPQITGVGGCIWSAAPSAGCLAATFSFEGATGSLPQPLPVSAISALSAERSGFVLTVTYSVNANAQDQVTLTAASHYDASGPLGVGTIRESSHASCEVSVQDSPFVFPFEDAYVALARSFIPGVVDPIALQLTEATYQGFRGHGTADLIVVLTSNSAVMTAPLY